MYEIRCLWGVLLEHRDSNGVSFLVHVVLDAVEVRKCLTGLYDQKGNVFVRDSDDKS